MLVTYTGRIVGALVAAVSCLLLASMARADTARPRVYMDCGRECVDDFYRQSLSYFDWVRDRHDADAAITIVQQMASNGGYSYTVTLRRPKVNGSVPIVRTVTSQPGDPPAADRAKLLKATLLSLFEALRGTPHEAAFEVTLPRRSGSDLDKVEDAWDHWVFAPEFGTFFELENNYYYVELAASLNMRRITEASKFRSTTLYERRSVSYVLEDDERVTGHTNSVTQRLVYALSIGRHWALGSIAVGRVSEYENLKRHLHGGPILEWNLFPYEENASRQLRLAYQTGVWYTRYFERTVFDRTTEFRPYHALSMIVDLNQAWGSVQSVLQANSFIDEPKRWRLAAGLTFSLALVAGLALKFEGEISWIHDQIGLRDRTLTDREIFLETSELEKSVAISGEFGFSYTFGSLHNTIVNPRFGRVDLEEE